MPDAARTGPPSGVYALAWERPESPMDCPIEYMEEVAIEEGDLVFRRPGSEYRLPYATLGDCLEAEGYVWDEWRALEPSLWCGSEPLVGQLACQRSHTRLTYLVTGTRL